MQQKPFISVIVPTYNRAEQLARCLDALTDQTYPRERFELIVVNDGGSPIPQRLIARVRPKLQLVALTQEHAGPASARNLGAENARGIALAFTDDDCAPAPGWLDALGTRLAEAPECLVGGRTVNALDSNPFSSASQALISYLMAYYNRSPASQCFIPTCNMGVSRDRFVFAGGFDQVFDGAGGEDREFCDRWCGLGYTSIYEPGAVVYHAHPLTATTFFQQHVSYGRGAYRFRTVRALRTCERIQVEPITFYINLLRYPGRTSRGHRAPIVSALLLLSQVANAAGFIWEGSVRMRRNRLGQRGASSPLAG